MRITCWESPAGIHGNQFASDLLVVPGTGEYTRKDSWRGAKQNLTLNYGLLCRSHRARYEKYTTTSPFIPGEQSAAFQAAPTGIVRPGDAGVSRTLAPGPGNLDFAPRIGLAPPGQTFRRDSLFRQIIWRPRKTERLARASGVSYAGEIPGDNARPISDNPPYGYTFQERVESAAGPLQLIDGDTGNVEGQRFPSQALAPLRCFQAEPSRARTSIFSQFEPIGATPGDTRPRIRIPYTEEYMLFLAAAAWKRHAGEL